MTRRIKFNSIETRLIVVLIFVAILPIITIGLIAHNMMSSYIRSERITEVGQVADSKHRELVMVLTRANNRAESFLSNLITQCRSNSTKLNHICAADLIRSYLGVEGALGATLRRKGGGDSLTIGTSAVQNEQNITFQTGQLAKFSGTGPENNRSYFISVTEKSSGFLLGITYPSSILEPVFDAPADLGRSGETFLTDGEGYFVTKHKYPSTQGNSHPISARPMQSCLSGQSREVLDLDYRGAAIIHGFRFVPEFGSGCIMAHIDQDEAFAPLKLLEKRLIITIFVFVVILIIITVYLAKNIVKPITKLTKVANTIAAGDYAAQAEVKGSNEISELASSFNFMTNQLLQEEARLRNAMAENLSLQAQMLHGQKLESLGVMAGGIAHDFNNLLMSMMGNTEFALINLSEVSPARESIEKIK
jgi:HAMP domain-containing protein